MTQRVRVKEACQECHSVGVAVVGIRNLIKLPARYFLPGLYVLGAFAITILLVYAWLKFGAAIVPLGKQWLRRIGIVLAMAVMQLLLSIVPLRMLVCKKCNRTISMGFGRKLPSDWLDCIEPQLRCTSCGYSLVGTVDNARCAECGYPFPQEWLRATAHGDPDVVIDCDVVECL